MSKTGDDIFLGSVYDVTLIMPEFGERLCDRIAEGPITQLQKASLNRIISNVALKTGVNVPPVLTSIDNFARAVSLVSPDNPGAASNPSIAPVQKPSALVKKSIPMVFRDFKIRLRVQNT